MKERVTSAPMLSLPDPKLQVIVEVDASGVGVGVVLSQRSPKDGHMHPCAFLSRKLKFAERNYDIGNQELLAVTLEEWRPWLEGVEYPFLVWTDHRNLEYLQTTKRLNSCQAKWVKFFNPINFHLSFSPGSKNAKPDTLSRIHSSDSTSEDPD